MSIDVVTTATQMRGAPRTAGPRGVVMTMGALHEGHGQLVRSAREIVGDDGTVAVTIFVNPTQFGVGEDFHRYPRSLDADVLLCEAAGADLVFAPGVEDVYGNATGFPTDAVTVDPGPLGEILEGASRPTHFRGVLTVVAKLLGLTSPDVALFGEKDYQQLVLIRRMVRDLSMPIDIIGVPTVREPDGLARSSRNRYLSTEERATAEVIPRALAAVVDAARGGADAAIAAGLAVLHSAEGLDLDYLAITDPELEAAPAIGDARVLVAGRVGHTRLIDNRPLVLGA
jgi:pantoate--beta-alanine ligase